VKNTKNIISAVIIVIAVGALLFFASPAPEKGEGIEQLRLIAIVISALAGIVTLAFFVIHIRTIARLVVTNLPLVITAVIAGLLVFILVYFDWPAEIVMKSELLQSVLFASLLLVGFVSIIVVESIRGNGDFTERIGITGKGINKLKVFLGQSISLGCLTILAIMVYFVIYEPKLFYIVWVLFIMQLSLLIFPILFTRIAILR